jgi:hypothetical protein
MPDNAKTESAHPLVAALAVEPSRRSVLRDVTLGGAALLATTFTAQPAAAGNMTQQAAGYQKTPKDGKRCDGCTLFQAPSSCKLVAGTIDPAGWCRFFVKK